MAKVRMNIELSQDVAAFLEALAQEEATTKTEIIRRALSVMKAYRQQKDRGRSHIGFVSDPAKLDVEIVGILS
ncbi:MAG TPA: ribbon-helix-helix protein, CopG family [Pedomonas sp.]|uniref:ribbon-helix-helix protein, CopG family n=1 Tax=Pedomonas sp. TaxID=2976421 RepID=UPI002F42313D